MREDEEAAAAAEQDPQALKPGVIESIEWLEQPEFHETSGKYVLELNDDATIASLLSNDGCSSTSDSTTASSSSGETTEAVQSPQKKRIMLIADSSVDFTEYFPNASKCEQSDDGGDMKKRVLDLISTLAEEDIWAEIKPIKDTIVPRNLARQYSIVQGCYYASTDVFILFSKEYLTSVQHALQQQQHQQQLYPKSSDTSKSAAAAAVAEGQSTSVKSSKKQQRIYSLEGNVLQQLDTCTSQWVNEYSSPKLLEEHQSLNHLLTQTNCKLRS